MRQTASLLERVRELVRTARHTYPDGRDSELLAWLADRLNEPLRVGIVGPPGSSASMLAEALSSSPLDGLMVIDEPLDHSGEHIDGLILLIRPDHPDDVAIQLSQDGIARPRPDSPKSSCGAAGSPSCVSC